MHAEQPGRAHDPAQQPAQHVAAALVGRGHPVADDHDAGPGVVGDHPEPDVVVRGRAVAAARTSSSARAMTGRDQVGLVDVLHALQQGGDALDAHPGVDVLLGQLPDRRVPVLGAQLAADVLHEDQVPDLQVPVLVGDRAALGAVLGAPVEVDLRAGPAGTGHAHVPVVVQAVAALDALGGQPGDPPPELDRLVVGLVHGDPDPVRVEAVAAGVLAAGDQVPGVLDGAGLEVVAEGEVAGHLEERVVPGGLADLVDVQGAHALLDRGGPRVGRRRLAQEVRLELHHARVDEQQVGVVEDQRGAGHAGVPGAGEVVGEAADDLVGLHGKAFDTSRDGERRAWNGRNPVRPLPGALARAPRPAVAGPRTAPRPATARARRCAARPGR